MARRTESASRSDSFDSLQVSQTDLQRLTSVYETVYNIDVEMTIAIDRNLDDPVYAQVADQIRRLIASGALVPGTALPSVRQLGGDLGVNLNTIARAYRLLEGEGFLQIRDRAGVSVAPPAGRIQHATRAELLEELRASLARLRQAGMGTKELLMVLEQEVLAMERP